MIGSIFPSPSLQIIGNLSLNLSSSAWASKRKALDRLPGEFGRCFPVPALHSPFRASCEKLWVLGASMKGNDRVQCNQIHPTLSPKPHEFRKDVCNLTEYLDNTVGNAGSA